jgi:phosphoribosylglycinamide formyltransferase 1
MTGAIQSPNTARPLPIVVLLSGRGSNMQAIARAAATGVLPVELSAVISDQPDAPGLALAASMGIQTRVLRAADFTDRATYDRALADIVASYHPGLVVLAGFMRILTANFIGPFADRILNIHPSLLPKFRGLKTHRRAIEAKECEHGVSVHFVTQELDAGPVVIQACIDIRADDTEVTLSARVQEQEHRIYPQAIDWFARGRLELKEGCALLDGQPLESPIVINARGE